MHIEWGFVLVLAIDAIRYEYFMALYKLGMQVTEHIFNLGCWAGTIDMVFFVVVVDIFWLLKHLTFIKLN